MKPIGILFLFLNSSQILFADFSLNCPPDVTVSCKVDYLHDLNVFGKAYTDFNGVITYLHDCKVIIDIDECGKGTIKRVWGTENLENWQWLSCMQIITISNTNGFTYADITWPQSLTIRSCDPRADLKNLQAPYDAPTWERPKCAKPMTSYTDTRFKVDDGCEKIIREWKILDWCQYDPILYPGRGIFTYSQVIKLVSTSDGVSLLCKKDTIIQNTKHCDTIFVRLDSAVFQSNCKVYHKIYNTSKYAVHSGANASGYYPNGITKFFYIAEYACGTEVKCEVTIDVRNKLQPTPYCLTGITLTLMPVDNNNDGVIDDGMIEVWASDLDKGSWHKCPAQKLQFSFSKDKNDKNRIYTCKDVGENEVEIWVTDSLGNQDMCKTTIIIQNNNPNIPNCDGSLTGGSKSISGKVKFLSSVLPPKIHVILNSSHMNQDLVVNKSDKYHFQFLDLKSKESYRVSASCTHTEARDLNYEDLSYLKKLIEGKVNPVNPYVWLAADINQDHQVDNSDYILFKHIIQFKRYHLLTKPWIFVPEHFRFSDPSNPNREPMPHDLEILNLDTDLTEQNILAIRLGDLVREAEKDLELDIRDKENLYSGHIRVESIISGPLKSQLHIYSEIEQWANIRYMSLDGKVLKSQEIRLSEGTNVVKNEFEIPGLLFYSIQTKSGTESGKFIQY
jgi:hypothetical protein